MVKVIISQLGQISINREIPFFLQLLLRKLLWGYGAFQTPCIKARSL
ncbi:unnamed protein product [Acanthoscelides obtectus]|uniref:Uncharacterized protein n=1 Tax=Acanthoscelides obtectus TaxID=200917 RepID=A0A9P0MGK3_ACAOB|nr:unnamed protein product [Acanthoscelides obtectus]CAK1643035.1 hypothetical protein AOBTE_LOCUS13383 [Acanthoscelides obtectus]